MANWQGLMQRIQIHPASGALPSCKHSSIFRPLGTLCPLTPFWLQRGGLNAVFTGLRGRAQQHAELQSHGPWSLALPPGRQLEGLGPSLFFSRKHHFVNSLGEGGLAVDRLPFNSPGGAGC